MLEIKNIKNYQSFPEKATTSQEMETCNKNLNDWYVATNLKKFVFADEKQLAYK